MTRQLIWSSAFLSGLLLISTPSPGGTLVTVSFNGTGTGANANVPFSGWVTYDPAKSGTAGQFDFDGSALGHGTGYTINGVTTNDISYASEPFILTTKISSIAANNKRFKVQATTPPANVGGMETTVNIVLPTDVVIYNGVTITQLPLCMQGSNNVFTASPATGTATFALSGGTTFTGNITTVSCSQVATAPTAPTDGGSDEPPVMTSFTTYATYPACPPRRGCFLSGLFHRRSVSICGQ